MNIQSITNSFSKINFQGNDKKTKQTIPYSQLGKIAAMALLLNAAGCGDDSFVKCDCEKESDSIECCLHKPSTLRLTKSERKLEQKAQAIAGDYYEVEYLPKEKRLKLTAGDICDNEFFDEADAYTYTMSNLKRDFALKNGTLLKYNPSLNEVKNQDSIDKETLIGSVKSAVINGRKFYSPTVDPDNILDEAILLPGQSLYIPINEIGQRLRYGQLPFKFDIFKKAAGNKNN